MKTYKCIKEGKDALQTLGNVIDFDFIPNEEYWEEVKSGLDYSKNNVYDAIGRPDLKPKSKPKCCEQKMLDTGTIYICTRCGRELEYSFIKSESEIDYKEEYEKIFALYKTACVKVTRQNGWLTQMQKIESQEKEIEQLKKDLVFNKQVRFAQEKMIIEYRDEQWRLKNTVRMLQEDNKSPYSINKSKCCGAEICAASYQNGETVIWCTLCKKLI
jgi:hypothetical protein